jgi:hypothetical protein
VLIITNTYEFEILISNLNKYTVSGKRLGVSWEKKRDILRSLQHILQNKGSYGEGGRKDNINTKSYFL